MRAREQRAVTPVKVGDRKQRRHQGIVPWCLRGVYEGFRFGLAADTPCGEKEAKVCARNNAVAVEVRTAV